MSFSLSQLNSLSSLISTNPNEVKALIKLASIDVLKSLGNGKFTVVMDGETLTVQSDRPLLEGEKYWTQLTHSKGSILLLSNLLKKPDILHNIHLKNIEYSIKDLQTILNSKNPLSTMKQSILEQLSSASTKEEFTNLSNLLLSIHNQTLTIPISFNNYYSILQFKKRYNKKNKKTHIDFYAVLEFLGPISGLITLQGNDTIVKLNVAFETTKTFLENNMQSFSHTIDISIAQNIEPLYNSNINSILDVSI